MADGEGRFAAEQLRRQQANPAAPQGLQQTAGRLAAQVQRGEGNPQLQPWMPKSSMLEEARGWYAGANTEGTNNGWNTPFYRRMFEQYDEWQNRAAAANRGSVFYDWLNPKVNPQATGVATWGASWDDQEAKARGDMRFGDVFDNGRRVANVYEDFDKATADTLMGELLPISNDDKARIFNDPRRTDLYAEEIEKYRVENTNRALYSRSAEDYDRNVKQREEDIRRGARDEATILGSMAASAGLGAAAGAVGGSFIPVLGTAAGAIGGAIVGGIGGLIGGFLNQDQLVEMTARAQERADIANRELGSNWLQRATMNVGEYSQVAMKMIAPASNIVQGINDARLGEVGDMTSEFYAVDADGNRKIGKVAKGFDIAATLADSVLQFASPAGQWAYMGTMGGVVAGKTAEASTGEVFNERRGAFDPLETWQERIAAAGSIGIDVAQIGIAGAVTSVARSSRALVTGTEKAGAEAAAATGMRNLNEGSIKTAGMKFTPTAEGWTARPTMELIAPSEFLRWVPAGYQARKLAKIDGGAITGEHLLQAATNLTGKGRFQDAVILGYSEGGEEFIQAYLDPARTGDKASFGEAFEAYLYGAASGAGMALGPVNRPPSSRQQLEMQAYVQHSLRTNSQLSEAEWKEYTKGWSQADFEKVARLDAQSTKFTQDVLTEIAANQRQDQAHHSSIGYARMEEMKLSNFDRLMRKALEQGNGSLVLLPQTSEFWVSPAGTVERAKFRANAGVMSAREVVNQLKLIHDGQVQMGRTLAEQLATAQANLQGASDPDSRQRWTDAVSELQAQLQDVTAQKAISADVSTQMLARFNEMADQTDPAVVRARIDEMNQLLVDAFDGSWTMQDGSTADPRLAKRAVELRVGRHPFMDTGSFGLVVPQIGDELTRLNAHGTIYVQQGMLKALGGDHDGDTVVPQHSIYLGDSDIDRLRLGDQYMRLTEVDGKPKVEIVMDRPDGEWAFMRSFSDAMLVPGSWGATTVTTRLGSLEKAIRAEFAQTFGGPIDDIRMNALLDEFTEAVKAGRKDAAMNLMQGMADENYEGMRTHRNAEGVPNLLWLNQKISETWDILQKDLAHVRSTQPSVVPIDPSREAVETTIRDEIARRDAGNAGGSLALLGASDAVRSAQFLHYSALYNSMTQIQPGETLTTDQQLRLTELFNQLSRGQAIRDMEKVTGRNAIEERVYYWLSQIANSVQDTSHTTPETLLLLANMSVADVRMVAPNEYTVGPGNITMLQFLLGKSLDIEEAKHRGTPEDSDITRKIQSLRRLTRRDPDRSKHSNTASLAMIEVLGNRPLHELIGNSSSYISPQMTLNQLVQMQQGMSSGARSDEIHRLVRSPAYIKARGETFGDPPWPVEVLTAEKPVINAFAMLVDAVKIYGDTYVPRLKSRNKTVHDSFIDGIRGLHQLMSAHHKLHAARLGRGTSRVDKLNVLRDMLRTDQRLAVEIGKLIPDGAALGVFQVHPDNTVTASAWLEDMLVEEDFERAAAIYYWNIKFAEFNQLAGTYRRNDDLEIETDIRGRIDPAKLKSRFHRVMWHLASQEDSIELARFMKAMSDAPSIEHQFDVLNNELAWRGDQAELLAWYDDVSLFEVDPGETWAAGQDGSIMRENIRGWGQKMGVLGSVAVEAEANYATNQTLLQRMDQWVKTRNTDNPINDGDARMYVGLLKRAIEQRRKFPDTQGQSARAQLVALQQLGLAATQNKGVADPMAAPFGEPLITMDSFGGFSDALLQELASITKEDEDAILSNLTMLADGPVRIGLADGSTLLFDISNEEKALEMLLDPQTQGLAMAILFPTVRDVNNANVSQVYTDTDSLGNLAAMLKEQTFKPLFQEHSDYGERLKQAHRYIGLIESYIRKSAQGLTDPGERDKAFHPVQQMVHDVMAAYLHSRDVNPTEYDRIRDQLFIDVADAIKAVASVEEEQRPQLRDLIAATMQERFTKDHYFSDRLLDSDSTKMIVEITTAAEIFDKFEEGKKAIEDKLATATTAGEVDEIEQELREYVREADMIRKTKIGYPHLTFLNAQAALKMFEMTGNPRQDGYRKAEILNYLGKQGRIHKALKKANQELYHKALRAITYDPNESFSPMLTEKEWKELGSWAAELYLRDITSRGSSSTPMTSALLGDEGAAVQRYFDQSFSYLADALFDPKVLEAADVLSQGNLHTREDISYDVAKKITDGLLSQRRLGTWNELIVEESLKARMVLKNSPVGAALAQEGNDPKNLADYVGAGKVTWLRPGPEHMETATLTGKSGQSIFETLVDDVAHVKLANHFVSRVTIQSADPNTPLDPMLADSLAAVSYENQTSAETIAAGKIQPGNVPLRVLDLTKLNERIQWLQNNRQLGDYVVEIEYVDVNKKPHERKWANNIFFDGVGREAVGGSGMGAIASLFFGLNGLNKVGQQNPLNMATKKGMGFRSWLRSPLTKAEELEANGAPVTEVMAAKAVHLLKRNPGGELMYADLPSLYKLVKLRHVVVGWTKGPDGKEVKTVWWPEQAIEMEQRGLALPFDRWSLEPLTMQQTQTLLGRAGVQGVSGTPGAMVRPTFNIADLDIFPSLDSARLDELGLGRIGEKSTVGQSRLAAVSLPPRAVATYNRGKDVDSIFKRRIIEWRGQLQRVADQRRESKLDVRQINTDNADLLLQMLNVETRAAAAHRLGIPEQGLVDLAAMEVSRQIGAQISRLMETEQNMVWVHRHGLGGDLQKGYVGAADIENNFAGMNGKGPTYGDVVIIDLSAVRATTDTHAEAAAEAGRILQEYAKRGVVVALQSSRGEYDLRQAVTEDLVDGSLGYRPMADSGNFFMPITEDADYNAAQRAIASTLLETQQFVTKNVALRLVADNVSSSLTEGAEWIDHDHDRSYGVVSHLLLPYMTVSTGGLFSRNKFAYGIPQKGEGRADQASRVTAQLLDILRAPGGREYLKKVLGGDKAEYPKYIEHENGQVEHGVLPLDAALNNLERTLEAGRLPSDVGQTVFWGTIIPTVAGDGSIRLNRVGFKPPSRKDIKAQETEQFGQNTPRITATGAKLDSNQTVPPPFVIDEHRSDVKGLSLVGTYHPNKMAKMISESIGLKSGLAWMPENYRFPDAVIGPVGAAGARVTRIMGSTSVVSKEAKAGMVNNFRDGFAVTGIDFSDDMIDYFFGSGASKGSDRAQLWELTQKILREWESYPHPYSTTDLSRILDNRSALVTMEARFNAIGSAIAGSRWQGIDMRPKNTKKLSPNQRLGTVILAALAAPGVRMEHVISTPGISTVADHDSGSLVRRMPALLTDALDDMDFPDLREMLIGRMNRNMPTYIDPATGDTRYHYWFDNRFQFHARMLQDNREEEVVGFLQIHVPIPADENALRYTYAGIDSRGTESQHLANTIAAATGGKLLPKARSKKEGDQPNILDELYGQNEIARFEDEDAAPFELYHMLRRVTSGDLIEYNPWMRKTPMEEEHIRVARGKVRQYIYPGLRNEETGWDAAQKADADRLAVQFLRTLKITDPRAILEVEYLVRQLWGIPGPATDQTDYREHLTYDLFKAGVEYMQRNIDRGMHPLEGGTVPLEHESFWKMVYLAQQGLPKGAQWLPLKDGNSVKEYAAADNWGEWVDALMGQMLASKEAYDSRFGTDLDGFLHTYQGTHADYMDVALSIDEQKRAKLIHPDTNRPLMSVDPLRDEVLREPIVLASNYMTYDALVGKGGVINIEDAAEAASSAVARRRAAIERWQRGEEMPKQKDLSVKEYARMGAAYQESSRSTSNAMRNLVNLSVTVRLFNPALWFSAMFEVPFRAALENATNVITGQSTGVIGRAQAAVAESMGLTPYYSNEDINVLNQLNKSMGESNKFLGLVYGELAYQSAIGEGRGRIGQALERSASAVAKMTADPRRGMGGSGLAKRYNDAVLEYLAMTNSQITAAQYSWFMMRDPAWIEKQDPRAHRIGLNAVQQARGAKATMAGNLIMRPIDGMTSSENLLVNYAGHAFKIPFLFTRFNANMLLTLTGLNEFDQVLAMFFDGRQKPQLLKKMSNRAKYGPEHETEPEYWDNSDVIESLDLSKAFVRGAVTHTALMTAGMMAGGLSLGGEDEEERRRKRLATYLNVPMYHDPLKAANDWRWHDAIFLDNVPVLGSLFKDGTGHSAVVPHWIFKQFLDPVLGMMRFFETGDISEIYHGFAEAASVWPTSVKYLWQDASLTAELLAAQADEPGLSSEAVEQRRSTFTNIVFMFEKALVENAFINGLYTAKDQFDRNPYVVPATESGEIVTEQGSGQPAPSKALQAVPFNPAEGEGDQVPDATYTRYAKRTGKDAQLHAYTEKNATAALAMSIIPWLSGKDSTYLRENMVTQRQRVKVDETDPEQVEKLVYSTFLGRGGQDFVTKEELIGLIKQREQNAGRYWNQADVEEQADAMYAAYKDAPLTIFDDQGKEQMTLDGKEAIFRSLRAGVVDLDNPAIAGFHVSWEERDEIAAKITEALVQEGVDLGLSDQSAMYRMRRIWFGDATNPGVPGLREILYDKRIPSKPYIEYDQLNVTYTLGPDGRPWATPFTKTQILGVLGVPVPSQMAPTIPGVTKLDERGNVVDLLNGINTGLAAIQPRAIEPEEEREPNDDAVAKAEGKSYTPGGGGYRRYGGGGYGGGSYYGPRFERMSYLPTGASPRIDNMPMINTSNPILRRADVRRERIQSERGRLKQWQ